MRSNTKWSSALIAVAAVLCVGPAPAQAEQATVALGSAEPTFTPADGGGGTTKLAITNLTDAPISVSAAPQDTANGTCTVQLDKDGKLPASQTVTFTATAVAACGEITKSFPILVKAGSAELPVVTATVKPAKKAEWDALWHWFKWSLIAAFGLMAVVYLAWRKPAGSNVGTDLPSLDKSWSFNESWVTNVTVVGGLLAGVFGSSEVVKSILGEDADESAALATIGGAISVALIGAAGVVVVAARRPKSGKFTVAGVLVGSALALGAAAGQLGVVYEAASTFEMGGVEDDLLIPLVAALVLLAVYGVSSVLGVLVQGSTEVEDEDPAKAPVSETLFAAAVIAVSAKGDHVVTRDEVDKVLKDLAEEKQTPAAGPAPKAAKRRRVRAIDGGLEAPAAMPAVLP